MVGTAAPERVVIMGAAGRDFHNFNMVYRSDPTYCVVAFTAAQIPGIDNRRYPASLAGPHYPDGIPIVPEDELAALCQAEAVDNVVFAYSDVPHATVMHAAARAQAAGATFTLLGPRQTMLTSRLPVLAISAARTGCGKSPTGRWLSKHLRRRGLRAAVIRHPMPYGDLARQRVQRFASPQDLSDADCTIEEREEYEPHIAAGNTVYAGVDYADILALAEGESDLILWEGGNNDFPFVRSDLHIVLVDALRPDQLDTHHPGETVLRMADVVVVAKADAAAATTVDSVTSAVGRLVPGVPVLRGGSPVSLDDAAALAGKRVLVVEDGPTITHGGMPHGAGYAAARAEPDVTIVDPRPYAGRTLAATYDTYGHIGPVLPAVGYDAAQRAALAEVIAAADADAVIAATPVDLASVIETAKPVHRVRYDFTDIDTPGLGAKVDAFLIGRGL